MDPSVSPSVVERRERQANHSNEFVNAFFPIKIFLQLMGRLPFEIKTNDKGVSSFHFNWLSLGALNFVISALATIVPFLLVFMGFIRLLARFNKDDELDWCFYTWEDTMMARHIVPVTHSLTWLALTFLTSLYMFLKGHQHAHYFNYWNCAIKILDMNVTDGLLIYGWTSIILLACTGLIASITFASYTMPVVYDSSGMVAHLLIQFYKRDIYKDTIVHIAENAKGHCSLYSSYYLWTWLGFFVQLYAFYGARSFMVEYQFFCRALRNAAKIWNQRFTNVMNEMATETTHDTMEINENDQSHRRLELNLLLKDHLIIIKLFKMTEATFQWILMLFYFVQMINLFVSVYFISQIGSLKSCNEQYEELQGLNCTDIPKSNLKFDGARFIECGDEAQNKVYGAIIAILFFVSTVVHFWDVTMATSNAFEEAMRGFQILRGHVFTKCKQRKERNFIQSLATSFAKNNPIGINSGGYFQITREFVLVVFSAVITCFVILLQTRPSAIVFNCGPPPDI